MSEGRGAIWAILGLLGIAVGVVALVIALDAKNGNQSDEDLANSVKGQINKEFPQLQGAVAAQGQAARTSGKEARKAGAEARRARSEGQQAAKRAAAGAAVVTRDDFNKLSAQIASLQRQVNRLSADEQHQQAQVNAQANEIDQLKINKKNRK